MSRSEIKVGWGEKRGERTIRQHTRMRWSTSASLAGEIAGSRVSIVPNFPHSCNKSLLWEYRTSVKTIFRTNEIK